jgi:hypothetical protein
MCFNSSSLQRMERGGEAKIQEWGWGFEFMHFQHISVFLLFIPDRHVHILKSNS